jgi:solute carrier family 13 (sodium-dependent dicarboxylate transporter), member 2/3/5
MAQAKKTLHLSKDAIDSGIDVKRLALLLLGIGLFFLVYYIPSLPDAVDPNGKVFQLTPQGKSALGLFLLAATWWVFEVVPIGITGIMIAVMQSMFHIRDSRVAFTDFMDPSVWFIFGSIVFGLVFTKTGLAKRMAYKMLILVGEKTSMIYLGCFLMTAILTLIMAHTAVAATLYPLFMSIYALYGEGDKPSRFGKGLFIGMAFTAGAGSIITLLGAARGAVALGFFKDIVGREVSFFELSYYMAPLGMLMVFVLWAYIMIIYKPERASIPDLKKRAKSLEAHLGPVSLNEKLTLSIIFLTISILGLRSFVPVLGAIDKSTIILLSTIAFFLFNVLSIKDLEDIPWNIILLFGGAMSIGFCLWQTSAAEWLAIHWLTMFQNAHWFVFVIGITFFVLIMTNLIMNVAAITISLPVALIIAPYLNVSPEIILYASLAAAGMPFLFLVGAAPNAIAYSSRQFTSGEFFMAGVPASVVLLIVIGLFALFVWPMMGMPITLS